MSDSYKVLTRKYRPRSFDDVVSQDHVISTLKNAIAQNRISHAYLFCGPRGVGKTTMARVVARMINGIDLSVDGEELGRTLDIIEIDAASNSGVDDVRSLRDGVRVPPQNGTYKVYIIDEVHMLSKPAFNALLKTLEEPPPFVKFIFATTEPHKVLPTVLSRVQRFDFRRIKVSEIVSRLRYISEQESIRIDDASLHVIARKADGALRDALSIMDQAIAFCGDNIEHEELLRALNVINSDRIFELMDCAERNDTHRALQIINDLLYEGHDIQELLVGLTEHLRNLYIARSSGSTHLIEASEGEIQKLASSSRRFSEEDLLRMLHISSEAQIKIKEVQQPRIFVEVTILKLVTMEKSEGLQALLSEIRELKKKTNLAGNSLPSDHKPLEIAGQNGTNSSSQPQEAEKPASPPKPAAFTSAFLGTPSIRKKSVPKITSDTAEESVPEPPHPPHEKSSEITPDERPARITEPKESEVRANRLEDKTLAEVASDLPKNGTSLSVDKITEHFPKLIDLVKSETNQIVYFSLNRTRVISAEANVLTLECQDDFVARVIIENDEKLCDCLQKVYQQTFQIKTVLAKNSDQNSNNDPYVRFKQLIESDPKVRSLVELFGAELEY